MAKTKSQRIKSSSEGKDSKATILATSKAIDPALAALFTSSVSVRVNQVAKYNDNSSILMFDTVRTCETEARAAA